ncbi:MAG: hypothetical protein JWN95_2191 [Frankiales bacterium]|nr:hypothetical protein [Frankiales bacterium]
MCDMCNGWSRAEVIDQHRALIAQHGWSAVSVAPDGDEPSLTYTIGLFDNRRHPEIAMSGGGPRHAYDLLAPLALQILDGRQLRAGDEPLSGLPHRTLLIAIRQPKKLVFAQEVQRRRTGSGRIDVPGLQLVWSNLDGVFPWQQGWDHDVHAQRLIGRPKSFVPPEAA